MNLYYNIAGRNDSNPSVWWNLRTIFLKKKKVQSGPENIKMTVKRAYRILQPDQLDGASYTLQSINKKVIIFAKANQT